MFASWDSWDAFLCLWGWLWLELLKEQFAGLDKCSLLAFPCFLPSWTLSTPLNGGDGCPGLCHGILCAAQLPQLRADRSGLLLMDSLGFHTAVCPIPSSPGQQQPPEFSHVKLILTCRSKSREGHQAEWGDGALLLTELGLFSLQKALGWSDFGLPVHKGMERDSLQEPVVTGRGRTASNWE